MCKQLWSKKQSFIFCMLLTVILCGCENTSAGSSRNEKQNTQQQQIDGIENHNAADQDDEAIHNLDVRNEDSVREENGQVVTQGGPYGEISIYIPDDFDYELCETDSEKLVYGMYGIRIYPKGVTKGHIEVIYVDGFGVCGTGLSTKEMELAGVTATVGTYDNHEYWDYIVFDETYKGLVVQNFSVQEWWSQYQDQVMDILDTVSFDNTQREGGAYIYNSESEVLPLGLCFSLENITATGATLVFRQTDQSAVTGELEFGDDFKIQYQNGDKWVDAEVVVEGDYGFHALAYIINPDDVTKKELDWEWLYGKLKPGNYRIVKSVAEYREPGDYDNYTVYAYFLLND